MRDVLPQLGLVFVLVLINAAFAGTELALVSLREGRLQRLERQSRNGSVLAELARDPNREAELDGDEVLDGRGSRVVLVFTADHRPHAWQVDLA